MNDVEVIDRDGNRILRKKGDVLRDGEMLRIPVRLMDAAIPGFAAAAALADSIKRNEQFDARNHRPGFVTRDAATSATIEKALDDRDKRLTDAWKNPTTTDATPLEKAAVLGAEAPKETLFAARDQAVTDRDRRTSEAWRGKA